MCALWSWAALSMTVLIDLELVHVAGETHIITIEKIVNIAVGLLSFTYVTMIKMCAGTSG